MASPTIQPVRATSNAVEGGFDVPLMVRLGLLWDASCCKSGKIEFHIPQLSPWGGSLIVHPYIPCPGPSRPSLAFVYRFS